MTGAEVEMHKDSTSTNVVYNFNYLYKHLSSTPLMKSMNIMNISP